MKRILAVTVAAISVVSASLLAVPAASYASDPAVTFTYSALDYSTPGHVTGTVSSDAPFVHVRLASNVASTKLTLVDGTATFDLETWGYGDSSDGKAQVQGVACPADPVVLANCSAVTLSDRFIPTDVTPQVTWFADDTVGPNDPITIDVTDAGGGTLQASFVGTNGNKAGGPIAHNGPTTLDLDDGDGYVWITRCSIANPLNCSAMNFSAPVQHDLEVRRTMTAEATSSPTVTGATTSTTFDVATFNAENPYVHAGTYTLSWKLQGYDLDNGTLIPGTAGPTQSAAGTLVDGVAKDVPLDVTGLTDGTYIEVGTITVVDQDFGTYSNVSFLGGLVTVDRTGPSVSSITATASTIYPLIKTSKRPGSTTITVNGTFDYQERVEIRKADGTVIAQPTLNYASQNKATFSWNGTNDGGTPQPAGSYKVVVLDPQGNASAVTRTVAISGKRLVTKTYTRIVTARASLGNQYVGRCSQLRKPSRRPWAGSLGFYSNTRCGNGSVRASAVSTVHSVGLPAVDAYVDVRVDIYGGAARQVSTSRGTLSYVTTKGAWVSDRFVSSTVGWHAGATRAASGMVFSDRSIGWGFVTANHHQYDVAKFKVVVRYKTLG